MDVPKTSSYKIVRRIASDYMRPYLGQLAIVILFMIIAAASIGAFAALLQPVFDKVFIRAQHTQNTQEVWKIAGQVFATFFVSGLATYIYTVKMNRINQFTVRDIQRDVFDRLVFQPMYFFQKQSSGELTSRLMNDVQIMRQAITSTLTGLGKSIFTLIALLTVMIRQDPILTLCVAIIFPLSAIFIAIVGKRLRKLSRKLQNDTASLTSVLIEMFQGIDQIKAYTAEHYERARAHMAIDRVRRLNIKAVRIGTLTTPINEIMVGLAISGIVVYGAYQIMSGDQTPGGLVSFIGAFSLAYEPMKKIAKLGNTLQMGVGAAEKILEVIDLQIEDTSPENVTPLQQAPAIYFDHVDFAYQGDFDRYSPVLKGIDFKLPAGKSLAIIGPSGAGKSTLLGLLLRFFDPVSGAVYFDKADIAGISVSNIRSNISYLSQKVILFDDTVIANIAYGDQNPDLDRVREAAQRAFADEFIEKLPEGYNTNLGEGGGSLSGGQRQRLALARAFYKNAPILLLDEATSALDPETEALITQSIDELRQGRTTIIVAHKRETIQNADYIAVMDSGELKDFGSIENMQHYL